LRPVVKPVYKLFIRGYTDGPERRMERF